MRLSGWIFMLVAWISILSLVIFCFHKMFKIAEEKEKK